MSSTIIPTMRYKDAPAAITFLCAAFGFREHLVVPGAPGEIAHAQLQIGNSMIMLGSVKESEYDRLISVPSQLDGQITQSPYVIIQENNLPAHYEQAKAAGATIVFELKKEEYGGSAYTCKDLEGHLWTFGSYDPWALA